MLRCSFCSAAWELTTYACIYCDESGEPFVTAAPDEERKDRRVEVCSACGGYLKTVDLPELSPFPLLAIADLETMDLDVAAMEHGYARPPLKEFAVDGAEPARIAISRRSSRGARRDSCSMSLCRQLPCASIVTIAGKSFDAQVPHRFGRAELQQRHAVDAA